MGELLKWNNATVTICHSKTKDLPQVVSLKYVIDWPNPQCKISLISFSSNTLIIRYFFFFFLILGFFCGHSCGCHW